MVISCFLHNKTSPKQKTTYCFFKRFFDVFASCLAILLLAIPMCLIAIAIKIDSPGNIIYKQERLGKNGKRFTLYKFRTMYMDAEKNGPEMTCVNDKRITRCGRWLRLFRLDEILQFFNTLKGDMSIVGPRPEREIFHKDFCNSVFNWEERLSVKQGITGLAQINGGYNLSAEEKLYYDLEYIKNRSLLLDMKVLLKTILIIFNHNGSR